MIEIGLKYTSELTVTDAVTAIVVGSGDMPVLATPMMMALMENAAMLAVKDELPEGCTTVGGHIESSHLKPSKIGDVVKATAEVTKVDGKKIEFKVCSLFWRDFAWRRKTSEIHCGSREIHVKTIGLWYTQDALASLMISAARS